MLKELKKYEKEITRIKKEGYIKEIKGGKNGALKTLYELFKLDNNEKVTIKLKNDFTRNYVAILNAKPEYKGRNETKRIYEKYGYFEGDDKRHKVLRVSVQANYSVLVGTRFLFKLVIDYEKEMIFLNIYDSSFNLIESKAGWSFASLKDKYYKKERYILLVKYWMQENNNGKYYKYYDYVWWEIKSFEEFLKLLEDGTIRVTMQVDTYKSGAKIGNIKDHGTCFEIQELDLEKLYQANNF